MTMSMFLLQSAAVEIPAKSEINRIDNHIFWGKSELSYTQGSKRATPGPDYCQTRWIDESLKLNLSDEVT